MNLLLGLLDGVNALGSIDPNTLWGQVKNLIMLFLQACIYLRIRLVPGKHLREIFFTVQGSGSWQDAIDTGAKPREVPFVCQEVQREMGQMAKCGRGNAHL